MASHSLGMFLDASAFVITTKIGNNSPSSSVNKRCLISSPLSSSSLSSGKSRCLSIISLNFMNQQVHIPFLISCFVTGRFSAIIIHDHRLGHTFEQVGDCVVHVHDVGTLIVALVSVKGHIYGHSHLKPSGGAISVWSSRHIMRTTNFISLTRSQFPGHQ